MHLIKAIKEFCLRHLKKNENILGLIHLGSNNSKRSALVSYIIFPLMKDFDQSKYGHTNAQELLAMIDVLLQLGFDVDIIDWKNTTFLPKKNYDIFIDIHQNMERLLPHLNKGCKNILYATGSDIHFQNLAELKRIDDLYSRKKIKLRPRRIGESTNIGNLCDSIIVLGNSVTQDSYSHFKKPIYAVPVTFNTTGIMTEKNFDLAKNEFLWYGGGGAVHKGLDILIEIFSTLPNLKLHIFGNVAAEDDFFDLYKGFFRDYKNIVYHGWVRPHSRLFYEISESTAFVILPSCSEGQSSSVINAMSVGMIPIITPQVGIDSSGFGIEIQSVNIPNLTKQITEASKLSSIKLKSMSRKTYEYTINNHNMNIYKEKIRDSLIEIMKTSSHAI